MAIETITSSTNKEHKPMMQDVGDLKQNGKGVCGHLRDGFEKKKKEKRKKTVSLG